MKKNPTSAWLRYLVNFWTLVAFAVIVTDFVKLNGLDPFIGPVLAIYIGLLVVYSAEKEFERWAAYYEGRHPGEVYVIAWTVLLASLLASAFFFRLPYRLPSEVVSTYIGVVSIMAFTKKSKSFFSRVRRGRS